MKKIKTAPVMFALSLIAIPIAARAQEKADIEVSYRYEFPHFTKGDRTSKNQYILLANAKESKFYSPRTEYVDSMSSTADGKAKLQEMQRAALQANKIDQVMRRDGSYYVFKSNTDNILSYYDVVMTDYLYSVEEKTPIEWELCDSTKTILDYECMLATAKYHGREWNAWFTPEIPLQEGPWKLCGLPGLILEAESADGQYLFTATGLQNTDKEITPIYLADQYEKVSRTDLLKAKRAFYENPVGKLNAQAGTNISITFKDEKGNNLDLNKPLYLGREQIDFLETDY